MKHYKKTIEERFSLVRRRGGGYLAIIEYRGKAYTCIINDSTLWDDYHGCHVFNTRTQAIRIMYNECKRENNLR